MKSVNFVRMAMAQIVLGIVAIAVLIQMVLIITSPEAQVLLAQLEGWQGQDVTFTPDRGMIVDRHNNLLAGNITVYEVTVNLTAMRYAGNAQTIALHLSSHLSAAHMYMSYAEIYEKLDKAPAEHVQVTLTDYVTIEEQKALETLQENLENGPLAQSLYGVGFLPHLMRAYPEGPLASNLIGFVNRAEIPLGFFGVEEKYNSLLSGVPQTVWVPNDPNLVTELPDIQPGATLILTIDREIQASVEAILDDSIDTYEAESGTIVVMDPRTGEILALATTPRMDPNLYWEYPKIFPTPTPYNRAISQAYEPGSVFKILTMAAALDSGTVQPNDHFYDPGYIYVGGAYIENWDLKPHYDVTMTECLELSLNVCLASIAQDMGDPVFYQYMQRFGIGHLTNIDLSGEDPGRLKLRGDKDWYDGELGVNSFGQGVSVTTMQMVMAASALANNGQMVVPHVLYGYVQDGAQHNTRVQIAGTPITDTTATNLTLMLEDALNGYDSAALVPGYRLAGKTGTAQVPLPPDSEGKVHGYEPVLTNASFIGWGPVTDPQFLVYVWLEKPRMNTWASVVAAPVFHQVVEQLVLYLNIPPDDPAALLTGQ